MAWKQASTASRPKRNSRVPEMLAADLDSEVQACVMGARRMEGLFARA